MLLKPLPRPLLIRGKRRKTSEGVGDKLLRNRYRRANYQRLALECFGDNCLGIQSSRSGSIDSPTSYGRITISEQDRYRYNFRSLRWDRKCADEKRAIVFLFVCKKPENTDANDKGDRDEIAPVAPGCGLKYRSW